MTGTILHYVATLPIVILFMGKLAESQKYDSGCPDILSYRLNELLEGHIVVPRPQYDTDYELKIHYCVPNNTVVTPASSRFKINTDSTKYLKYEAIFPFKNPQPFIESITFNGEVMCQESAVSGSNNKCFWISHFMHDAARSNKLSPAASTSATRHKLPLTQQCSMHDEVISLVAGGQITKEGEWPWHVALYHVEHMGSSSSISYKCGGSLISASHVLTAAHCLIEKLTNRPIAKGSINIYLGTHNIKSFSVGVQFKLVDRLEIHQDYNPQTHFNDIGVLKLSSPAEFTGAVWPVCLWPEDMVDLSNVVGKNGSVVGWGSDEYGLLANELMLAELQVVSEVTCLRSNIIFHKYTNNFTFCAGLHRDTSLCKGDSGGGMVFKLRSGAGREEWFLRGLVSIRPITDKPCDPSSYVIFTDVANYLDWIKDSVSRDIPLN